MYAERMILETDPMGKPIDLPKLPPNAQLEAIFLVLNPDPRKPGARRQPHPDIAGRTQILGDIVDSIPSSDWDLPQ